MFSEKYYYKITNGIKKDAMLKIMATLLYQKYCSMANIL